MTHNVWQGAGIPPDPVEPGLPPDNLVLSRMIETATDTMMDLCKSAQIATDIVTRYDLNDDPAVMAALYQAIAEWRGGPESSHAQMKKLHNLMANQMQAIVTKEAEKWAI